MIVVATLASRTALASAQTVDAAILGTVHDSEATQHSAIVEALASLPLGAVVTVQDNRLGIPPGLQRNVLHRSSRGLPTVAEGTDLGLAIVAQVDAAVAGGFRFESVVGSGTSFRITLPARAGKAVPDGTGRRQAE